MPDPMTRPMRSRLDIRSHFQMPESAQRRMQAAMPYWYETRFQACALLLRPIVKVEYRSRGLGPAEECQRALDIHMFLSDRMPLLAREGSLRNCMPRLKLPRGVKHTQGRLPRRVYADTGCLLIKLSPDFFISRHKAITSRKIRLPLCVSRGIVRIKHLLRQYKPACQIALAKAKRRHTKKPQIPERNCGFQYQSR